MLFQMENNITKKQKRYESNIFKRICMSNIWQRYILPWQVVK